MGVPTHAGDLRLAAALLPRTGPGDVLRLQVVRLDAVEVGVHLHILKLDTAAGVVGGGGGGSLERWVDRGDRVAPGAFVGAGQHGKVGRFDRVALRFGEQAVRGDVQRLLW